ncbi:MAG: SRPBCC family protein [Gammaproteobacteria bacterium]
MLKLIVIALVALVAGLLIYAASRPNSFRVERSTTIQAPPERIFALIDDLHRWTVWSPWEKKDPTLKRTHSGAASGKGARYAWEGNKDVGHGSMEITESVPHSRIALNLDFIKPFEAHNKVEFALEPTGQTTQVIWVIHGPMPFISKLMSVFFSMDKMIGKDFEAGLADLKTAAES